MEASVALAKFPAVQGEGEGGAECSGDEESETEATRAMVASHNKKRKKSGGFQSMGFSHAVFSGIMKKGYRVPTPIQRKCIPLIMDGKDVVAMARTGSGKTAAFLLPMFERLKAHSTKVGVRSVILSPTRELANQTFRFSKELGKFTGLRAALVLGGDSLEEQFTAVHENPDIIVATPGRFLHLLVEMDMVLASVQYIVFDEADRLFEMGFAEQLQDIIRRLPESRQTLLFSATLPRMLVEFAKAGLREPVLVRLDLDSKLSENLKLFFFSVRAEDKMSALLHLLQSVLPDSQQTLVFAATKHHVEYLRELLESAGVSCTYIYSSLDQTARKINVAKFVNKKTRIMLVTDVAARGIDIPMLDNVINYNFPAKSKLFVHRVGRVARAGRCGSSYSLVCPDEVPFMLDLHLFLGLPLLYGAKDGHTHTSGVYGNIPQVLLDQGEDLLKHLLSSSSDLTDLKMVSENAQKQYVRSRCQPAPESIKRAKQLPVVLPLHPLFAASCSGTEVEQQMVLNNLRCYKPSQTIFEVNSTTKTAAKEVMKNKRARHTAVIDTTSRQKQMDKDGERGVLTSTELECADQVQDLTLSFQTEPEATQDLRKKKQRRKRLSQLQDKHYIPYKASDHHSEVGLALTGDSFDAQANSAVLDIDGDDNKILRKPKSSSMRWDRKRKKFVGPSLEEEQKTKRIKTESGHWIKASYKSDAYQRWRDKYKIDTPLCGQEEEAERTSVGRSRQGSRQQMFQRGGGGQRGGRGRGRGGGMRRKEEADLKPKRVILQKRQKKELLERMKKMKRGGKQSGRGFATRKTRTK